MEQTSPTTVTRRRLPIAFITCVIALLATGLITPQPTQAMGFYCDHDTTTFSSMAPNLKMNYYYSTDGAVAYCLDVDLRGPLADMLFETKLQAGTSIAYIISHGYPNTTTINTIPFSEGEAREVTQLACWLAQGQLSYEDVTPSDEWGQQMKETAIALAEAGRAYSAGESSFSTLHATEQGDVQPLAQATYFRWGPYHVEGGTSIPSTTIDNWTDISAYGAFTGDATGAPIDTAAAGWGDWYLYLPLNVSSDSLVMNVNVSVSYPTLPTYYFWTDPMLAGIEPSTIQRLLYAAPAGSTIMSSSGTFPLAIGSVKIIKSDAITNAPLAGATFSVEQFDGQTWKHVTDAITGGDGSVQVGGLPTGFTYRATEIGTPPSYLTPIESGSANMVEFTIDASSSTPTTVTFKDFKRPNASVNKEDAETQNPVSDTEYKLYRWQGEQVDVVEGHVRFSSDPIPDDEANWAADEEGWELIATDVTDENGLVAWDSASLTYGYYRTVETRPNRLYQTVGETSRSGDTDLLLSEDAQYFTLDMSSSDEVQIFSNRAIVLSCEIYKSTIDVTSAAFDERAQGGTGDIDNVATENYLYRVGFRSTSNTWADEFVVDDPLVAVREGQIRVCKLWTPIAWGDHDGLLNIWYQTNLADSTVLYNTANASLTNPANPNTLHGARATDYHGWNLWKEEVSSTQRQMLTVDDLGLADGEYLTAIRLEYGCVERGFKAGEPYDAADNPQDPWYMEKGASTNTSALIYAVECPDELRLLSSDGVETIIKNEARDTIFRNTSFTLDATGALISTDLTLWDDDTANVETRVIDTFAMAAQNNGIIAGLLPRTGDIDWDILIVTTITGGIVLLCGAAIGIKKHHQSPPRRR